MTERVSVSKGSIWKKGFYQIPGSSSSIILTLPLITFRSLHFIITAKNNTNEESRTLNMNVLKESGSTKSYEYGKIGSLKIFASEQVVGSNIEITIQNNESFAVETEYAWLKLSS